MKLGFIEVSGADTVVFYNKTTWCRKFTKSGERIWIRRDEKKAMTHDKMVEVLKRVVNENYSSIWTEGYTINVKRLKHPKFITTKFDDEGNLMKLEPDGRWRDMT